ncbi:MAG: hypothetical protein ACLS9A_06550 [Clostridia bacterium]
MLDKDIIRRRLDSGITYTEFSYDLQALDLNIYMNIKVDMQCAGLINGEILQLELI